MKILTALLDGIIAVLPQLAHTATTLITSLVQAIIMALPSLLMASVPPLLERWVSKYPRNSWRHCLRVRPRRAISGTGQVWKVAMMRSAMARPSVSRVWW